MIAHIYRKMVQQRGALEQWAQQRFGSLEVPIYSSADLRVASYKVSVVDTNLFPSGFNNLCETFAEQAAVAFRRTLERFGHKPLKILIIPEAHTRNQYYWANIDSLLRILRQAGHEPFVGRSSELGIDLPEKISITGLSHLTLSSIGRYGDRIEADEVTPDVLLLNNDFSNRSPELLKGIRQPVVPSPYFGWCHRRKSEHFRFYQSLVGEVAEILELDPWLLSPLMASTSDIEMHEEASRRRLGDVVDELIARIEKKHREHNVKSEPYVFIKDNSGTYGMAITHVTSGQQVLELGRRKRNRMIASKGGQQVSNFLIQEGLPTNQFHEGRPLEPVFYMIAGKPIGHFFRIHSAKTDRDNLNAQGMSFDCLCSHKVEAPGKVTHINCSSPDTLRVVGGWLAKIASYAASLELKELEEQQASIHSA